MPDSTPTISDQTASLECQGAWIIRQLRNLPQRLAPLNGKKYVINGEGISSFDTAGALLLQNYLQQLKARHIAYTLEGFQPKWLALLKFVGTNDTTVLPPPKQGIRGLAFLGHETFAKVRHFFEFFDFIGRMLSVMAGTLRDPRRFHGKTIINTLNQTGCKALPIVGLLCFLIGVVLAYQLGIQLKTYGANLLIVFLTGLAILREFGPLITAIIIAGRTSSAFTAEIGSMKVNQEIDALLTMGLSPIEFLVLPKILALLIIFPLLIFWADVFGVLGSMFMAKVNLGISYATFLTQFEHSIDVKQLLIGLSKAPVFALIIALVGCYQGFKVEYNTQSIGTRTTTSVVQAIFLIIIADAAFSVFYGQVGV